MLSVKESLQLTQPKNVRMEKDILCKQKQKKKIAIKSAVAEIKCKWINTVLIMKVNWIKTQTHVYASYQWNILILNNITEKPKVKERTWAS